MAQVKFGTCVDELAPRPDLQPGFFGNFVPRDAPPCLSNGEEKRRKDVRPSQYGNGTPSIQSYQRDPWGVPLRYDGAFDEVQTEQGPIRLPIDDTGGWNPRFLPSVSLLNIVPFTDNRMRALSDRYYK